MKRPHPCSSCATCPFEHHYDLYLKDILLALDSIDRIVEDMSFETFVHDRTTLSAVSRKFERIAQAVEHIPPDFQAHHLDLPWARLACMGDRLVHPSCGFDYQSVWDIIHRELPALKPKVEEIVVNL